MQYLLSNYVFVRIWFAIDNWQALPVLRSVCRRYMPHIKTVFYWRQWGCTVESDTAS
jgi:hypothetical protein